MTGSQLPRVFVDELAEILVLAIEAPFRCPSQKNFEMASKIYQKTIETSTKEIQFYTISLKEFGLTLEAK